MGVKKTSFVIDLGGATNFFFNFGKKGSLTYYILVYIYVIAIGL